ncbi:MFS transporter [Ilumatobacter fluminis]|uniref:MFS transporter n=1 Tax=Ilumatobacter fluminis TaxID=467091 RepID=UPI001414F385|nr:MFS transporter [Ilumatobacter fluminis]
MGALTGPGQTFGVSVFVDHIVTDLALSRSGVATAYLIGTLIGAVLQPAVGSLVDRFGVRKAQAVLGVAFGVALMNMSYVDGFVWLVLGFAGIRFLGQGALTMVATVTVQVAFNRRRGVALGIHTTVVSALIACSPLVLALLINAYGWRTAWLLCGLVVGVTISPIALLGLRHIGAARERDTPVQDVGRVCRSAKSATAFTRREALRTAQFWMLASVVGASALMVTSFNFHQIDLLGRAGFSEGEAAALFLPQVIGSSIAGLAFGVLSDRMGVRFLPAVAMLALIGAQLVATVVRPGASVVAFALFVGLTQGAMRASFVTVVPAWFGIAHVGAISGVLTLVMVSASAIGPLAMTLLVDATGTYASALLILLIVPLLALALALGPNQPPRGLSST